MALGQEPYAWSINQASGLPSDAVYGLFQDSKGFIWVGTDEGISKYDGFEFITYRSKAQSSAAGSAIQEDTYGRIWYQNFDGFVYYVQDDSLKTFTQNPPAGFFNYGLVGPYLMLYSIKGVDIYRLKDLAFVRTISIATSEPSHTSYNQQTFLVSFRGTVMRINADLSVSEETSPLPKDTGINLRVYACQNKEAIVFYKQAAKQQIYNYLLAENKLVSMFSIGDLGVVQGFTQLNGHYWFLTSKGAYVFDRNGSQVGKYFENSSISAVIQDRQGNYWFSTTNKGLFLVPSLQHSTQTLGNYIPNKIAKYRDGYLIATKNDVLLTADSAFANIRVLQQNTEGSEFFCLYADEGTGNVLSVSSKAQILPEGSSSKRTVLPFAMKQFCKIDNAYYAFAATGISGILRSPQAKKEGHSVWDVYFDRFRHERYDQVAGSILLSRGKSVVYDAADTALYYATNAGLFVVKPTRQEEIKQADGHKILAHKLHLWAGKVYALTTQGNLLLVNDGQATEINTMYLKIVNT